MSDHPEIIAPVVKILEGGAVRPAVSLRAKAMRAVGFLEGMSMWLWTQIGPDLDDEVAAEYDRRVADIAEYVGLPPREE